MASKTVTVEPVDAYAAGCRATCASYYDGTKPPGPHDDGASYTNYQCSATVAASWRFVRFEYVLQGTTNRSETYTDTVRLTTNPAPLQQVTTNWENPFEWEVHGDDGSVYRTIKEKIISVKAVFEQIPHHDPTNLLVNTYSKSIPVKLVHDPATHKLVADY